VLLSVELVIFAAFIADRMVFARNRCIALLFGEFSPYFWTGAVLFGTVVPVALYQAYAKRKPGDFPTVVLCTAILIGGFFLRFCILMLPSG